MENKNESKIDVLLLWKKLLARKKYIIKASILGGIVGILMALSMPKEYTSTVILFPDSTNSMSISGSMSSLAALAGINLQNLSGAEAMSIPDLYPSILQSSPFIQSLFDIKVKDNEKQIDTTLYQYMSEYQKSPWWAYIAMAPSLIRKMISSDETDTNVVNGKIIPKEEMDIIEGLIDRMSVSTDKKTSITTITITMQSPEIAAFMADTLTSCLQEHIIRYRTMKAQEDVLYAQQMYEEAQSNYYKAQQNMAAFLDRNQNIVSARYRINQEKLQNETNLTYSLYNQMAQQLQLAKLKEQNTKPFFTIIQPAIQPLYPNTSKVKVTLIFIFLFGLSSIFWVLRAEMKDIIFN